MSHYLYLVRHGEQQDAEHGLPDGPLSERGKRQARLLAERLGGVPFSAAWHSPLERAAETARIMTERLPALESQPSTLLFDCVPSGPTADMPSAYKPFFGGVTEDEIEEAFRWLYGRAKLACEPAGAVGMAAVLAGKIDGGVTAVVVSGGNVGADTAAAILSGR